jgi:hypothetical protein
MRRAISVFPTPSFLHEIFIHATWKNLSDREQRKFRLISKISNSRCIEQNRHIGRNFCCWLADVRALFATCLLARPLDCTLENTLHQWMAVCSSQVKKIFQNNKFYFWSISTGESISLVRELSIFVVLATELKKMQLRLNRTFNKEPNLLMFRSQGGGPCEGFEKRWRTTTTSVRGVWWKIYGFSSLIGRDR